MISRGDRATGVAVRAAPGRERAAVLVLAPILAFALTLGASGCHDAPEPASADAIEVALPAPPSAPLPSSPAPAPEPKPQVVAGGDLLAERGLEHCRAYLDWMRTCFAKLPPDAAAGLRDTVAQTEASWLEIAQTDAGRDALNEICRTAFGAIAESMPCEAP